jgi:hypothetical protein
MRDYRTYAIRLAALLDPMSRLLALRIAGCREMPPSIAGAGLLHIDGLKQHAGFALQ